MLINVYITNPDEETARSIARNLLEKGLIACANVFPIHSMYTWKGKMEEEKEVAILAKTTRKHWDALIQLVTELHPYELPCIECWDSQASQPYTQWVKDETQSS